ncbi:CDP-alcohol phosphatidyltransferase-domain-containing protein [Gautieria morchelliformis]|nr:CDP-alcohol phosphatidyltransferase-domain-containing protein [Gautieria morchelliformis]
MWTTELSNLTNCGCDGCDGCGGTQVDGQVRTRPTRFDEIMSTCSGAYPMTSLSSMMLYIGRPASIRRASGLLHHRWRVNTRFTTTVFRSLASSSLFRSPIPQPPRQKLRATIRENIYTLPNILTVSRILACPVLGWSIINGNFEVATSLLVYAGITDWVDGYIARRYNMRSVIGTILDPAADKALMTTLTVTLACKSLLPVPLAIIIIGRDVLLSFSAFYYRYLSLPSPKTFRRYWDFSIPSAEVRPTEISKINTALQLLLMGSTTISPLLSYDISSPLVLLQWLVAGTTIWSGLSYVFSKNAVRILNRPRKGRRSQ